MLENRRSELLLLVCTSRASLLDVAFPQLRKKENRPEEKIHAVFLAVERNRADLDTRFDYVKFVAGAAPQRHTGDSRDVSSGPGRHPP